MKPQVAQHIIDGKTAAVGAGSFLSWLIAIAERWGTIVDFVASIVALVGGVLAVWWTAMRIRDAYAKRKISKPSKDG